MEKEIRVGPERTGGHNRTVLAKKSTEAGSSNDAPSSWTWLTFFETRTRRKTKEFSRSIV